MVAAWSDYKTQKANSDRSVVELYRKIITILSQREAIGTNGTQSRHMKYIKRVKRIVIEGQLILFATDQLRGRREFLTKSQGQS